MARKTMPKSELNSDIGQPQPTPMPTQREAQAALAATPQQRPNEFMKVSAMEDYPHGRGGMQTVPMVSTDLSEEPVVRPGTPIGAKPPVTKMPTTS